MEEIQRRPSRLPRDKVLPETDEHTHQYEDEKHPVYHDHDPARVDNTADLDHHHSRSSSTPATPAAKDGSAPSPPAKDSLLGGDSLSHRFRRHFTVNINTKWADIPLITCFFVSGLVDSVAFNVWSTFVSMQTGNTIFIALGASHQPISAPHFGWARSLVACGTFLLGALCFSSFHRHFGPIQRWVLVSSFATQCLLIAIAASLATSGIVDAREHITRTQDASSIHITLSNKTNWLDLAPLAFLAFQGSGQIVASRALQYQELPTVVVTSLYCDLISDPHLFTAGLLDDPKRNRRFMGALMLFCGAVSGGFFCKSWAGLSGALWVGCVLKCFIVVAFVVWKPMPPPPPQQQQQQVATGKAEG